MGRMDGHDTEERDMTTYSIYQSPGWHGQPTDPLVETTDDEHYAAMMAGECMSIRMAGGAANRSAYAVNDETGERVDEIESYRCDECGEMREWGDDGPTGTMNGRVLECAESMPGYLVTWLCPDCASDCIWPGDDDEEE